MSGIYGLLSKEVSSGISNVYAYFYNASLNNTVREEYRHKNFLFGRSCLEKFQNDRVLESCDDFIIAFEGLQYNKQSSNTAKDIRTLYRSFGKEFIHHIEGNFSGFLLDKQQNRLLVFNDHLNTKPLYYFCDESHFIFASELKVVSRIMSTIEIKKRIDTDGIYSLLAFGYVLNNSTLIQNVRKMDYGTILEMDLSSFALQTHKYFQFKSDENIRLSHSEIISGIDVLLTNSVKQQWQKDLEYGYEHYAFLSGGLDSRVNVLLAHELGYKNVTTMTFSQTGSNDQHIAQQIATDYEFTHRFMALDNGHHLQKNLENCVQANDGLNLLIGSAAGLYFLSSIDHKPFGSLHTGQIGDLLFGSYVKDNFTLSKAALTRNPQMFQKISWFETLQKRYENDPELFGYEQRVIHATFNGDRSLSHYSDITSPFYNKALIEFCLSIPKKYKKHEAIYLDWFNKKHPRISEYPWEQAGVRPTSTLKTLLGRQWLRYSNAFLRRLGMKINDMNPYDQWLKNNTDLQNELERIFSELIDKVEDPQLRNDISALYGNSAGHSHYGRYDRFIAVTALLALKLHFFDEHE